MKVFGTLSLQDTGYDTWTSWTENGPIWDIKVLIFDPFVDQFLIIVDPSMDQTLFKNVTLITYNTKVI